MHNLPTLLQLIFTNYRTSFKSRFVLVIAHPREWIIQSLVHLIQDSEHTVVVGSSYWNFNFKDSKRHSLADSFD